MKEVCSFEISNQICEDYNINPNRYYILNPDNKNGPKYDKIRIKNFVRGNADKVELVDLHCV